MRRTDDQFKEEIFRRKTLYESRRKTRRILITSALSVLSVCLVLVLSFHAGLWRSERELSSEDVMLFLSVGDRVWTDPEEVDPRWFALAQYVTMPQGNDTFSPESFVPGNSTDAVVQGSLSDRNDVPNGEPSSVPDQTETTPSSSGNDLAEDFGEDPYPIMITATAGSVSTVYSLYSDRIEWDGASVSLTAAQVQELTILFSEGD